jgi:DNA-binding Xre family transcriptional regulator
MGTVRLCVKQVAQAKGFDNPFALSQKSGLNYAICYRLWHSRQLRIDLNTLGKLCDALRVQPGRLFDYKKEPK